MLSCQVDQTSLNEDSYYTTREGLGAEKINADDQTEAIKTAQENMLENVQSDRIPVAAGAAAGTGAVRAVCEERR